MLNYTFSGTYDSANTQSLPVPTVQDIKDAFKIYDTTLDVKMYLRNQGFWVSQRDVSIVARHLKNSGYLRVINSGRFNRYTLSTKTVSASTYTKMKGLNLPRAQHLQHPTYPKRVSTKMRKAYDLVVSRLSSVTSVTQTSLREWIMESLYGHTITNPHSSLFKTVERMLLVLNKAEVKVVKGRNIWYPL